MTATPPRDDPPAGPDVAVIIVNYGTADLALAAVDSVLARDHGGLRVEVHLVDNASPGGDAARIARALQEPARTGRVTFYPETVNHGFGRGNNLVLQALAARPRPPRFVFLLNPDARLAGPSIETLARFLDDHPRAGCAGARTRLPDGTPTTAAFRFPSIASEFSDTFSFGPVARLFASRTVPLSPLIGTEKVDWVSGAAVMFRFEALRQAALFDPVFFLYFEEVELMGRLHGHGWEAWHVADAVVIHEEGVATGLYRGETVRKRRPPYWYRSWAYYFLRRHGRTYAFACAGTKLIAAALNHAQARLRGKRPYAPLGFFQDFIRHGLPILISEARVSSAERLTDTGRP